MLWLRCALLALLLATCTAAEQSSVELRAPEEPLVWPPPPAAARIEFLYGFREPRDLGIRPAFFKQVWETIVGEENRTMVRPYAVAVQGGRLAVADPGLGAVHLFDRAAKDYRRIVQAGDRPLITPVGVAFGGDLILVADSALEAAFAFDSDGELVFAIRGLERPTGLAYDPDGDRLFVSETLGHRISVFDGTGKKLSSFGGRGAADGEFNYPSHLFLRAGRLYVNDTMNFRVQAFGLDGRLLSSFGRHGDGSGDFAQPKGIAVDSEQHVYVVDAIFDRVQIFDAKGKFLLAFGESGVQAGGFWLPSGLFIAENLIYVADSYNSRVQVFRFLGGD